MMQTFGILEGLATGLVLTLLHVWIMVLQDIPCPLDFRSKSVSCIRC